MKIYLKGYYGYQNFGDELLMFGVIEKIFSRYEIEELIIEVGSPQRCQKRLEMNSDFFQNYYASRKSKVDWNKVHFFDIDEYFQNKNKGSWGKRATYLQILLGNHPYSGAFKIFGGGEVIDESRNFPHNGWNLLFLYFQSIWKGNFALRGGLGSQKKRLTRKLTQFLIKKAKSVLLRDQNSYKIALKMGKSEKIEITTDFSTLILQYFLKINKAQEETNKTHSKKQKLTQQDKSTNQPKEQKRAIIINLSPTLTLNKLELIEPYLHNTLYFFPCDINFDLIFRQNYLPPHTKTYLRTEHKLTDTFEFLQKSEIGLGSRLHFLYCFKLFKKPFIVLSESNKLQYNLNLKN